MNSLKMFLKIIKTQKGKLEDNMVKNTSFVVRDV